MRRLRQLLKKLIVPPLLKIHRLAVREAAVEELRTLRSRLGHSEQDLEVVYPWDIRGVEYVFIGKDVFIGPEVLMIADRGAEIHIGDKVMFGPRVRIIASDHRFDDPARSIKDSGYGKLAPIVICNGVWIGTGATILRGVTVAEGSVIGAGAVLTKSVGRNEVWAGNPALKVRDRFVRLPAGSSEAGSHGE